MTARKPGTASRTRKPNPLTQLRNQWQNPVWSTRRVAIISTAACLFYTNPKTIMALVVWGQTIAVDWYATAQQTGLVA